MFMNMMSGLGLSTSARAGFSVLAIEVLVHAVHVHHRDVAAFQS
jgi:hypothetical protein